MTTMTKGIVTVDKATEVAIDMSARAIGGIVETETAIVIAIETVTGTATDSAWPLPGPLGACPDFVKKTLPRPIKCIYFEWTVKQCMLAAQTVPPKLMTIPVS